MQTYHLHSNVLRENSKVLARFLVEERGASLGPKAKKLGVVTRYKLVLNSSGNEEAKLQQLQVNSMGQSKSTLGCFGIENGTVRPPILRHWDNLLRAFYHQPLQLEGDGLANVLKDTIDILNLADKYRASSAVAPHVGMALLNVGKVLFKAISADPVNWSVIGKRARSKIIVKEAIIHLVGKWESYTDWERGDLLPQIREVCERKHLEFTIYKKALDMRMLGHYSPTMVKKKEEDPGRVMYANDVFSWIALNVFRHWFSQMVAEDRTWRAEDGGFSVYKKIHQGGDAYLNRPMLEGFHAFFPMSPRAQGVLRNHLIVLKNEMQKFVEPLLANNTQVELKEGEWFKHLVSTKVDEEDLAWLNENGDLVHDSEKSASSNGSEAGRLTPSASTPTTPGTSTLAMIESGIALTTQPHVLQNITNLDSFDGQKSSRVDCAIPRKRTYDAVRDCTEQNGNQPKRH